MACNQAKKTSVLSHVYMYKKDLSRSVLAGGGGCRVRWGGGAGQVTHDLERERVGRVAYGPSISLAIPCEQNYTHEWKHYLLAYYVRGR